MKIVFRADIDPHARGESNYAIRTEMGRRESVKRPHQGEGMALRTIVPDDTPTRYAVKKWG